jgi:hypothetical protein
LSKIVSAASVKMYPPIRGLWGNGCKAPDAGCALASGAVEADISPEPAPEERAALVAALEQLAERERARDPAESAWWRAGVRENLETSS